MQIITAAMFFILLHYLFSMYFFIMFMSNLLKICKDCVMQTSLNYFKLHLYKSYNSSVRFTNLSYLFQTVTDGLTLSRCKVMFKACFWNFDPFLIYNSVGLRVNNWLIAGYKCITKTKKTYFYAVNNLYASSLFVFFSVVFRRHAHKVSIECRFDKFCICQRKCACVGMKGVAYCEHCNEKMLLHKWTVQDKDFDIIIIKSEAHHMVRETSFT